MIASKSERIIRLVESKADDALADLMSSIDQEDSVAPLLLAKYFAITKLDDGDTNPRLKTLIQHVNSRLNKLKNYQNTSGGAK